MPRLLPLALAAAAVLALAGAHAAPVKTEHVEAELVSERTALVPGQTTTVALRLRMQDGWHTYWRNPGDSGLPTTLTWTLPPGVTAGPLQWPAPRALPAGPLVNYGYEGEVLLLADLAVAKDVAPTDALPLSARAEWLVCRETCIPEEAKLDLPLPVAGRSDPYPQWGKAIAATRDALPAKVPGWVFAATGEGDRVRLSLTGPAGAAMPTDVRFFPHQDGRIEPAGRQAFARDANGTFTLTLPVANQLTPGFTQVAGVLTSASGFATGGAPVRAILVDVPLTGTVVAGPKPATVPAPALNLAAGAPAADVASLAVAMVFAFLGGIVLNLMPCVFPVLSLKALSLAAPGHGNRRKLRLEGLAFGGGVVVAFVALAALLLAFRAAGEQFGWGFQLQSPAMVTGLALLFFVLALNMSGAFEFTALVPSSAADWSAKNRYANAALSGVLAVVVASPCTAPFMGAALGFALAQPAALTLAVFVALGVGMALPFLLLSWFPGWRRLLPRPGAWMERLKQFLAFPLYGTVAWLAWVLGAQVDNDAVVRLLVTLVAVAFALWAWRAYRMGASRAFSVVAAAGLVGAAVVAWPLLVATPEAAAPAEARADAGRTDGWQAFTPALVSELTSGNKAVFVDFTAAWCVTCQVNKRLVLNDGVVREAFTKRGVELVRADWTRRDPRITQALAALGRQGVPVYVLYRPGQEPLLLPEVLQKQTVLDALATLGTPGSVVSSSQ